MHLQLYIEHVLHLRVVCNPRWCVYACLCNLTFVTVLFWCLQLRLIRILWKGVHVACMWRTFRFNSYTRLFTHTFPRIFSDIIILHILINRGIRISALFLPCGNLLLLHTYVRDFLHTYRLGCIATITFPCILVGEYTPLLWNIVAIL